MSSAEPLPPPHRAAPASDPSTPPANSAFMSRDPTADVEIADMNGGTGGDGRARGTERAGPAELDQIEADLSGVEVALERLDAGTYWTCEVTGQPLPDPLLAADPVARRLPPPAASTAPSGPTPPPW